METPIALDGGLPVASSSSPRLVPRRFGNPSRPNPPRFETRSGAIPSRGKIPGAHPPQRWDVFLTPGLGDIFAMEVLSSVPRECCILPVRIEEVDGENVTVTDVRDTRRWYVGRINRDSSLSRAQLVAGDLSAKK